MAPPKPQHNTPSNKENTTMTNPHPNPAISTPTKQQQQQHHEETSPCKTTASTPQSQVESLTTAEDWYLQGERVWYDAHEKRIVLEEDDEEDTSTQRRFKIFQRVILPDKEDTKEADQEGNASLTPSSPQRWMTFLPSNPEGSYGFHLVEEALSCGSPRRKGRCDTENTESTAESVTETTQEHSDMVCTKSKLARLYLDYQGQGDSDTPAPKTPVSASSSEEERPSTTKQRADVVEALWQANGIQRTVVVSAGDSSLVVMELLQRQRQRLAAGSPFPKILHVLSLNGRYVAKTRHSSQLATITQLLRSERMGPSLAGKAQRSEFTLSQCLGPYLKGSSRAVRRQVADILRRHEGATSLVEMARTVDDHLYERHRYRWHLPHLLKVFTLDQGITFHMVTNTRSGQRQVKLVQQQLHDYELEECPGIKHTHYDGRGASTTSFLLGSLPAQLEALVHDVRQIASEEIPLSDNSMPLSAVFGVRSSFEEAHANDADDEGEDSWHPNEEEMSVVEEEEEEPSLDTRLDREIVFDASEMEDDDDFDFF